jgi:hypothetical protein
MLKRRKSLTRNLHIQSSYSTTNIFLSINHITDKIYNIITMNSSFDGLNKTLISKNYPDKNNDHWWFNLSSPEAWTKKESIITLILKDEANLEIVGKAILRLYENDWYNKIMKASQHRYRGRYIIKVHLDRKINQYYIYFGQKSDGYYPISIEH